ncbi:Flp pilus assembly protein CpaB [Terrihalobacillus insolitus]|uniref:Flp pilus assembly protein CpaB n=1 Tax=Terrihalobacillus insolitus TaxID=2950438 RepID=UPI002341E9FC|nr:Flp pilus assembly protein CpaB [Terrihalobacillus insolitus]MDC3413856.1 Flp pilus assembly protein CpaB [Terrihalobacillus insolitus]
MNTRKIWMIAMVLGVIAAGFMYVIVTGSTRQSAQPTSTSVPASEENVENKEEQTSPVEAMDDGNDQEEEKVVPSIPVSKGKRAMTIPVTDVQGIAGLIKPGSYVDIVAVMETPEEQEETQHDSATILLQNVKVLAVGHAADEEENKRFYQMVTVEVLPKEGLTLGFATRYQLYLMLRQDGDNELEPDATHIHEDDLHEGVFQ